MLRPLVQGDDDFRAARRRPVLGVLAAAHVFSALTLVLVLSQVGHLVGTLAGAEGRIAVVVGLAAVAAAVDLAAVARARMAPGLSRQTPKGVADDPGRPWWVTPLVWGADTGIIGTTFRVSSASWLVLAAAVGGLAPWWTGAAYGLAFALPLVISVRTGQGAPACTVDRRRGRAAVRAVQLAGVAVLLAPLAALALP